MAKKSSKSNPSQETSSATTNTFNKGMVKDYDPTFVPEGAWSHARNLVNNSVSGDLGIVGNEPANLKCVQLPYTFIGAIPIVEHYWAVYTTDDINSEIGLFNDELCEYVPISNDTQWGFKRTNIIIGASKQNFDCSYQLYWVDALNPDRTLNIGDIRLRNYPNITENQPWPGVPYECTDVLPGPCVDCQPNIPLTLDLEKTRIARLMKIPCVSMQRGFNGGQLLNGSYYAVVAYTINQQRVTDYFNPSQIQTLFSHNNATGSLDISFSNMDTDNFQEFELVIVGTVNQQTVAKRMGIYGTETNSISVDFIDPELATVPISYIPLRSPAYEKSEGMYTVNNYLIRTAPTAKFDFNYQPLANQIRANWVMVEQPANYYENGGNENGYMRDEQYAFWIRWVYNTGERSSSYHIPGRPAEAWEQGDVSSANYDNIEFAQDPTYIPKVWEVVNTAYVTQNSLPAADAVVVSGQVIARGKMGYWESTEVYPPNNPDVWNATQYTWANTTDTTHDLCGLPIRHHKMPADAIYSNGTTYGDIATAQNYGHVRTTPAVINGFTFTATEARAIRVLGVEFENIKAPVDNNGDIIPGVIGYEILRSNRQGNRTIVAKGIIRNMRYYNEGTDGQTENIYYQNYVCNYLGKDHTLTEFNSEGSYDSNLNDSDTWNNNVSKRLFTFHSPDTTFNDPFLSATELKLYGELGSRYNMRGSFSPVPGHPKEKLITNLAFIIAAITGIGVGMRSLRGRDITRYQTGRTFSPGLTAGFQSTGGSSNLTQNLYTPLFGTDARYQNGLMIGGNGITTLGSLLLGLGDSSVAAIKTWASARNATFLASFGTRSGIGPANTYELERSDYNYMSLPFKTGGGVVTFASYWMQGTDAMLELLKSLIPYRDYVYRSLSHVNLNRYRQGNARLDLNGIGNTRRWIQNAAYIDNQITTFSTKTINNLFRSKTVAIELNNDIANPLLSDNSVQTIGSVQSNPDVRNNGINYKSPNGSFHATGSAYYAGMKVRFRNQYGQIESPKEITTGCVFSFAKPLGASSVDYTNPTVPRSKVIVETTPVIFGGDVYIGRYTEKNTFFYFYDWLYNTPIGTEIDYSTRYMVNYARFFADFTKYDSADFVQGLTGAVTDLLTTGISAVTNPLPSGRYNLDRTGTNFADGAFVNFFSGFRIGVKNAYMYLFQSGVLDFYVETEYNVDHRDYNDIPSEQFYDPYGLADLTTLFDTSIIKVGNFYKYDISLGLSRIYNSYISWGAMQDRGYNPVISENCYSYFPNRVIYSLPQNQEDKKDYWTVFLVNNYNDFDDKVVAFKSINKNGAIILFEHSTPLMFNAVDQLQTTAGIKITIGDGGLFSQPLQTLSNADPEFQHGSSQHRLSIINTPAGIYWMSASQGKIFTVGQGMNAISDMGMKWWFSKYLKMFLLGQFPDFQVADNPVVGIGCQSLYDNDNGIIYFCKKDYRIRPEFLNNVTYLGGIDFAYKNPAGTKIAFKLGDRTYCEDLSWTISYDAKLGAWLSFHDWHPEYAMSSIKGFLTTQTQLGSSSIWKHGNFTDKFCNFYGINYPWEIDYISQTGQAVNTTRSVEYIMESYIYDIDGIDRYQVLDYNFDKAVVYNTEQVSGTLNLTVSPKNNAPIIVNYPQINPNSISILFSKEEQKYRFNQFWDITNNRGEFIIGGVQAQQPIWNTELNGYIRVLNINNLNYNKSPFDRKKFRHYVNHVVLTRTVSDNVKMLLKVTNNKLLNSPR
jgi:hypothetical protein